MHPPRIRRAPHAAIGSLVLTLLIAAPPGTTSVAGVDAPSPAVGDPPQVRDIAEILIGEVTVVPDPSGRAVTLEVTTSIDAACAVVFGPDPSFGRIATDQDMGGGAHRDHHPVLTGLEPDSTVYYRIQGSGPDGSLFASETMSLRTPAAAVSDSVNLALEARVVEFSSEYSEAFGAGKAIDGDGTTAWASAGDGGEAFITLDLGHDAAIGSVLFRTRSMADGTAVTETFSLSVDGRDMGIFQADEPVTLDLRGRLLRFDVETSSGGNTGALEIEVLAAMDS